MTDTRAVDQALESATERLIDAQDSVGQAIDAGEPPELREADVVVRRAEDVAVLAEEAARVTATGSPSE